MMSIGGSEILVLLVIGLIVLGPERLPKVAKTVARMYRDLRKYADDMRRDISKEMQIDDTPATRYKPVSSAATGDSNSTYDYGYDEDKACGEEDADGIHAEKEDDDREETDLGTDADDLPDDEQVADQDSNESVEAPSTDEKTPD